MNELAPRDFMAQDIFQTEESVYKSFAPSLAVSNRGMMQLFSVLLFLLALDRSSGQSVGSTSSRGLHSQLAVPSRGCVE